MKICIHIEFAASCIAITNPSFSETVFSIPRNTGKEIISGGLQDGKLGRKFVTETSSMPASKNGIEVVKLGQNNIPELGRSGAVGVVTSNSKPAKDSNKRSDDWPLFHLIFSCLLPFWILWMCGAYSMKPNVKIRGAPFLARPA